MKKNLDVIAAYSIMLGLIILVGFLQSWSMALSFLCLCLISAVMTIGANIQWGYAGLTASIESIAGADMSLNKINPAIITAAII